MLLLAAAGIAPVIIHMVMREKPRRITFPAVRFLQARVSERLRKLRLKHLLLLALRVMLIVFLALAFARPALKGGWVKRSGDANVVIVIDDSLSMLAQSGGVTRFARARERASGFVKRLSGSARIAVGTVARPASALRTGRAEALASIEALRPAGGAHRVWSAIADGAALLARQKEGSRALVIFTDMTANAWRGAERVIGQLPGGVRVSVVPVEYGSPSNLYFSAAKLRSDSLDPGAEAVVEYTVGSSGNPELNSIGLYLDRRKQSQSMARKGRLTFRVGDGPFVQGELRIDGEDDLTADNRWPFTVAVARSPRVLLVRPDGLASGPLATALRVRLGKSPATITPAVFASLRLAGQDAVVVEGLEGLSLRALENTLEYVAAGGGLLAFGGESDREEVRLHVDWRILLPGFTFDAARPASPVTLEVVDQSHPISRAFAEASYADRNIRAVICKRYLRLGIFDEFAFTKILAYSDGTPALMARIHGNGRILFFAGAPSPAWSDLIKRPSFVVLVTEALKFLTGRADERFNYFLGEFVPVRRGPGSVDGAFALQTPASASRERFASAPRALSASAAGHYALLELASGKPAFAFSAAIEPQESRMERLDRAKVEAALPGAHVVTSISEIELGAGEGEGEVPVHNAILLVILLILSAEEVMANRFYRKVAESD